MHTGKMPVLPRNRTHPERHFFLDPRPSKAIVLPSALERVLRRARSSASHLPVSPAVKAVQ